MIQGLEKFGKVEQCEQIGDKFHILITDGFDRNARNTFHCMQVISDAKPEFPIVDSCHSDTNIFHLVLKK